MNQEELAKIKQMWAKCRGRTIRVVDQDQMDRLTFEMHNKVPDLLAHIDAQADQIEALKALLIDDRCKCIILIEKLKVVANDPKWMEKGMKKSLDEYMDEARKQLAEDEKLKAAGVTCK